MNLRKLFCLCEHRFEIFKEVSIFDRSVSNERPIGYKYFLKCKNCGKIKSKKV